MRRHDCTTPCTLIPRLAPLTLDAVGLSATIENLVRIGSSGTRRFPST